MKEHKNKWPLCAFFLLFFTGKAIAHIDSTKVYNHYKQAYDLLDKMLQNQSKDFKTAVYYVENAYLEDTLSYKWFDLKIKDLAYLSERYVSANNVIYPYEDSQRVMKYGAVFKIMTDTIPLTVKGQWYNHLPYHYNFEDFDGTKNWENTFVSTLLESHKGNCHSLPYLYKIIVQEMGEDAYLALAPNHIYVKLFCKKDGWYNTELTSGQFPIDGWLMASGYIHLNAVQNGIYMDTLGDQKSIALCILDLAQGYQKKMGIGDGSFIEACCNLTLKYFPDCIAALLLKAEIYQHLFTQQLNKGKFISPKELISHDQQAEQLFYKLQSLVKRVHDIGYRRMPEKMYLDWLASLTIEKDKYTNKNHNFTNTQK